MAEATLVFRVPVELQDVIINVVDQILNVKDLLSSPPYKSSDTAFSSTGIASVASNSRENNNNTLYNAANVATGKEESKEDKREIVKEKNEETKEEPPKREKSAKEAVEALPPEARAVVEPLVEIFGDDMKIMPAEEMEDSIHRQESPPADM